MNWHDILRLVDLPGEFLVVTDNGQTTSNMIAEVALEKGNIRFSFSDTRLFGAGGLRDVPPRGDLVFPVSLEPEIMGGAIVFDSILFRVTGSIYFGSHCSNVLELNDCKTTQALGA